MKQFLKNYSKIMDVLYSVIRIAIAVVLVVMVCVTTMEVVRRYVFRLSFIWAEELVRFLLVATTFLGGAAAYRSKALAALDLVTSHLGEKANKIIDILTTILIIVLCCYLTRQAWIYSFTPAVARMVSTGLKLKMTYIYLVIPIGFAILVLFAIEYLLEILTGTSYKKGVA